MRADICKLLGIKYPIIMGGMTLVSGSPAPYMEQLKAAGVRVCPRGPLCGGRQENGGHGGRHGGGGRHRVRRLHRQGDHHRAGAPGDGGGEHPRYRRGRHSRRPGAGRGLRPGGQRHPNGHPLHVCKECKLPDVYKQAIINARANEAVVEGPHLPKVVPHRSIKTPAADEIIAYELTPDANPKGFQALFDAGRVETTGNLDKAVLGMGQSAGLIDSELSAAEIMEKVMGECRAALEEMRAI